MLKTTLKVIGVLLLLYVLAIILFIGAVVVSPPAFRAVHPTNQR
jgi:hypothetical protein